MRKRLKKKPPGTLAISSEKKPKLSVIKGESKAKSVRETVYDLRLQQDVVNLKMENVPNTEIATALGISKEEVVRLLARGLEEYYADRDDALQKYIAHTRARYDRLYRTYEPLARGYLEKVEVKQEDGSVVTEEKWHPPNLEAGRLVARLMNDENRMMGVNRIRVEHTGANGGQIVVSNLESMSDEQLEKVREKIKSGDASVLRSLPR